MHYPPSALLVVGSPARGASASSNVDGVPREEIAIGLPVAAEYVACDDDLTLHQFRVVTA
jgi:hypothetical protein